MTQTPFARLRAGVQAWFTRRPPSRRSDGVDSPLPRSPRADAFERVEEGLRRGTPDSVAEAVAIGRATDALATADLVRLAGPFLVTGHADLARDLVDEADRRDPSDLGRRKRRRLDNLRAWTHPPDRPEPPPDAVQVGVFHYRQPDRFRGSKNIGDYVQTLALLGNLARFSDVEFSGVDGLGELVTDLQARVRPELRIPSQTIGQTTGQPRRVHLVPVSRDFSRGDPIDEGTWLPAFGWHLHSSFGLRYGLPYHPGLRPVFFSFHLHSLDALDEQTLSYLRAHGPIGCRDWATVDVLLSADVDAFFTGCVTSTVDAVFAPLASLDRSQARAVGVIDSPDPTGLPPDQPVERFHNAEDDNRDLFLDSGTRAAIQILERYQAAGPGGHQPTPRLPTRDQPRPARGLPALGARRREVHRAHRPDPRLGCIPGHARRAARAVGRRLRAHHRRHTRRRRVRRLGGARDPPGGGGPGSSAGSAPDVPACDRAEAPARDGPHQQGWRTSLSRRPRERGGGGASATGGRDAGREPLLLPDLLPDMRRVVVLPADGADARDDVTRLAGHDLGGRPVGAHRSQEPAALVWRRAADRLSPEPAAELRRVMGARHPFATRALGPGPLVLDLELMRSDGELADVLALAAYFGLDGREALLAYAGPHVAPLPGTVG